MNHEYVLFSKNTCQNSMVNVLDKDKILWYVMRAYKNEISNRRMPKGCWSIFPIRV